MNIDAKVPRRHASTALGHLDMDVDMDGHRPDKSLVASGCKELDNKAIAHSRRKAPHKTAGSVPGSKKKSRLKGARWTSINDRVLTQLSQCIFGWAPGHTFVDNCKKTLADWASLLAKVIVPEDVASGDPGFVAAFAILEGVLSGNQTTALLRRLAFVEMMRLSDTLQVVIKSERDNRRLYRPSGCGDASMVMDVHGRALQSNNNSSSSGKPLANEEVRRIVRERRRTGRRYVCLAGPSPLCLLAYSGVVETFV